MRRIGWALCTGLAVTVLVWGCGDGSSGTDDLTVSDPGSRVDAPETDPGETQDATAQDPGSAQPDDGPPPDSSDPIDTGDPADPGQPFDPGTPLDPGQGDDPGTADPGILDHGPLYHPEGWASPSAHGTALNAGESDCRACHGQNLEGAGHVPGCDGCHAQGWRSDCTFCHGGIDNDTGAPPRDLDGATAATDLSFPIHTAHVAGPRHPAYGCKECHSTPATLLAEGHVFDDTPGQAEVAFTGLSNAATRDPAGSCANLYCHGNGQGDNGSAADADPAPGCDGCHASKAGGSAAWGTMSGEHKKHMNDNMDCSDCHGDVVEGSTTIKDKSLHVNGTPNTKLPGITIVAGRCTGSCHGEFHAAQGW